MIEVSKNVTTTKHNSCKRKLSVGQKISIETSKESAFICSGFLKKVIKMFFLHQGRDLIFYIKVEI